MSTLTVLGGADIGGSCYLIESNGVRILCDCGIKNGNSYTEHPEIPEPEKIDAVFISHAHMDHMGALAYVAAVCGNAYIFMSEDTAEFTRYQLDSTVAQYIKADSDDLKYHNMLLCNLVMSRVTVVDFCSVMKFTARNGTVCQYSLFHAGHVPGGAMLYVKIGKERILYTGDFSANQTALTSAFSLPPLRGQIDTVVMCATNANRPNIEIYGDALGAMKDRISQKLTSARRLLMHIPQLTKGLEILKLIDDMYRDGEIPRCTVYVEAGLYKLARRFEYTSHTFRLPSYIKLLPEEIPENGTPAVVIVQSYTLKLRYRKFYEIRSDFSLHADYGDITSLIDDIAPERVYVVHYASGDEPALQQRYMASRIPDIIYTENNASYTF